MEGSKTMAKELKQFIHNMSCKNQEAEAVNTQVIKILKEYYIPDHILLPDSETKGRVSVVPLCPVIVFINSKSGGQLGGQLLSTYRTLLNKNQVFDLGEKTPDKVLHHIYFNLEKHKQNGDNSAAEIQKKLRIIVAGGDGTVGWLLGVISDLKLSPQPPVATMPLGTGNNISFSFGWGKKNPGTSHQCVKSFLDRVKDAKEMKVDSWHILMRMRAPAEGPCDPIAPLELPHSLHPFRRVSESDELNEEGYHTYRGGFWNYFSMGMVFGNQSCDFSLWNTGMDAQVSYAFHRERKLNPEKFKHQLVNQTSYAKLSCTQGWFCTFLTHPTSRNIAQLAKVKIMKTPGQWIDLHIPPSIRSIVCLNLPSFSGGLNPWGSPSKNKLHSRDLTPPYADDGFFEVVGFRDAWHGLILFTPNGHGTRLAQANRIRFEFHKGASDHAFMRLDGEPWKQPLPLDDDTVTIEISHFGRVTMLGDNEKCQSRSIRSTLSNSRRSKYNGEDRVKEDVDGGDDSEERRKLGAADTFRLPDDFDLARVVS